MRLAVLMGNRCSPWHLAVMKHLPGAPEVVAIRADSEIQRYFAERGADQQGLSTRPIYFDYPAGPMWKRLPNLLTMRYRNRAPRLLPFHAQLRDFDVIHTWELFTDWTEESLKRSGSGAFPCVSWCGTISPSTTSTRKPFGRAKRGALRRPTSL